ncbi:MAG: hypothetical protein J2P43_07950, partial [Candidatus Dormibacteraeota bacterium]|nr:hypothetical protein [Candidatus Dormibacteraeota bacterium]
VIHVRRHHAEVPAVVSWPRSLAGTPHVVGSCVTSRSWDARANRLELGFAPNRRCAVQVS